MARIEIRFSSSLVTGVRKYSQETVTKSNRSDIYILKRKLRNTLFTQKLAKLYILLETTSHLSLYFQRNRKFSNILSIINSPLHVLIFFIVGEILYSYLIMFLLWNLYNFCNHSFVSRYLFNLVIYIYIYI